MIFGSWCAPENLEEWEKAHATFAAAPNTITRIIDPERAVLDTELIEDTGD